MIIKNQRTVICDKCGKEITVREYEGLEGTEYTDHFCEGKNDAGLDQKGKDSIGLGRSSGDDGSR